MALPYKVPNVLVTVSGADEKAVRAVELFVRQKLETTGVLMLGSAFPSELEQELVYKFAMRVKMRARAVAVHSVNTSKKPATKKSTIRLRVKK